MAGTLYIVATPIGNLEDMTLRALRTLKEVDLILAEDTRVTKKLLMRYDVDKPILSYHQHSKDEVKLRILSELLSGKNIALVTDAGTPGISDPGNELIDFLLEKEPSVKIIPIPGASAITTALSVCGFRADKFIFLGFMPKKKKNKLYEWLRGGPSASSGRTITFAFYESPHRLLKTLSELKERFSPENRVFVARELTKLHENLYRGNIDEVIEKLSGKTIKGEIVVIVEG